ncbi:M23 family metallopeptidase [Spirochaeta cellobiosiphila]|uniref:M23 family metallopeptidase n=1 Tax=Spirochaeta cellobiosiphila TaxID=504483 RepID=UPI00040C566E|nr:M23 family metallopeptidase [Spirochaeta cellobiosiphila]
MLKRISVTAVLFTIFTILSVQAQEASFPLDKFVISSNFGYREPVMGGRGEGLKLHRGIDIVGPPNAPIKAVLPGVVVEHWPAPNGYFKGHPTYGGMVVIDHGNGHLSLYAHMKKTFVKEGQKVDAGEVIGIQGATGMATGDHLHFEYLTDPLQFLSSLPTKEKGGNS